MMTAPPIDLIVSHSALERAPFDAARGAFFPRACATTFFFGDRFLAGDATRSWVLSARCYVSARCYEESTRRTCSVCLVFRQEEQERARPARATPNKLRRAKRADHLSVSACTHKRARGDSPRALVC